MKKYILLFITSFILLNNALLKSNNHNAFKDSENLIRLQYNEEYKTLGHNFEPWATTDYTGKGTIWLGKEFFVKKDTLKNSRGREYNSTTNFRNDTLIFVDYGDTELYPITEEKHDEILISTARYTPEYLYQYLLDNSATTNNSKTNTVYSLEIGGYNVELHLTKESKLIDKIITLSYDELYGDVETVYSYSSYITKSGVTYPSSININKYNGNVIENISVTAMNVVPNDITLLRPPNDYRIVEKQEEPAPQLAVTKHNDFIHFIDLAHTDDRVLVVEIDDYIIVAEAPLNPANGELIISEIKKFAPNKEIKYFIFGHHHPHYLGGVRAFAHKGATIICNEFNSDYIKQITNSQHSLRPDSLHLDPKPIKIKTIKDSISFGANGQMKIYFMGDKSSHTKDYMVYYFPHEKLLFQDDLCSIPKEGKISKARPRQAGLYNFIKELNIDVETLVQSWPINNDRVKTIFTFDELEESINENQ